MQIRLAILAVLLMAAMAPFPGWAPASPGNGSSKTNSDSQSNNGASTPLVTVSNEAQSPKNTEHANEIVAKESDHRVTLTSVPPITITDKGKTFWDHILDWGPWFFGLFLAVAGGVQLWLLRVTWRTIQAQKEEMAAQTKVLKDSVEVANAQIEMMKEKERARIQVTPLDFDAVDPTEPHKIMIEFVNIGPTNAFDVRVEAGVRVTVAWFDPVVGECTDLAIPTLLKPDKPTTSWAVCVFPPKWCDDVLYDTAKIIFEVTGQIKYTDVFDTIHTEDFSYRMNVYGIEDLPRNFIGLKIMRKWHPFLLKPNEWNF